VLLDGRTTIEEAARWKTSVVDTGIRWFTNLGRPFLEYPGEGFQAVFPGLPIPIAT
jgi:hypothetical protein